MRKIYISAVFSALTLLEINAQNIKPGAVNALPNRTKKSTAITALTPKDDKSLAPRNHGLNQHFCASHELTKKYYEEIGKWAEFNQSYLEEAAKTKPYKPEKTPGINTISVIFHVVHNPNNPAENV